MSSLFLCISVYQMVIINLYLIMYNWKISWLNLTEIGSNNNKKLCWARLIHFLPLIKVSEVCVLKFLNISTCVKKLTYNLKHSPLGKTSLLCGLSFWNITFLYSTVLIKHVSHCGVIQRYLLTNWHTEIQTVLDIVQQTH